MNQGIRDITYISKTKHFFAMNQIAILINTKCPIPFYLCSPIKALFQLYLSQSGSVATKNVTSIFTFIIMKYLGGFLVVKDVVVFHST